VCERESETLSGCGCGREKERDVYVCFVLSAMSCSHVRVAEGEVDEKAVSENERTREQ